MKSIILRKLIELLNLNFIAMKKKFRLLLSSLVLTTFLLGSGLTAKAQLFDQGDKVLSFGIGIGSTYYTWGTHYSTTVPPIFISGDYCLREKLGPGNLGVGPYLGFSGYKSKWTDYAGDEYGYKYTTFIIGARGTYHFVDLVDKLDLYGGILLGAKIVTHKSYGDWGIYDYSSAHGSGVAYSFFAGARYYFSDNFAAMAELGYGIAWLSLGVSLKL